MKKLRIMTIAALVASGPMLSAQFTSLPSAETGAVDTKYIDLLNDLGWNPFTGFSPGDTAGWAEPPTFTAGTHYDPLGTARIFYIGKDAAWVNNLGVSFDIATDPNRLTGTGQFDPNMSFTAKDFFLFDSTVSQGHTVTINLAGMDNTFDFWLSTDPNASNPSRGGIWALQNLTMNNPETSPWYQARGTSVLYDFGDGEGLVPIHLLAFEDVNRKSGGSDHDFDDFVFGIQFFDRDGNPFTPIPEPSTYGTLAVLALLGLVALRRSTAVRPTNRNRV